MLCSNDDFKMSKKIIINESELKTILSEELSKISLLNTVLEYFKDVPPEYFMWKRNLSRGGKYLCYVCGYINKNGELIQFIDDKHMPINVVSFFNSLPLLIDDTDTADSLRIYVSYRSKKMNIELSSASDTFSVKEFEKDIDASHAEHVRKIFEKHRDDIDKVIMLDVTFFFTK